MRSRRVALSVLLPLIAALPVVAAELTYVDLLDKLVDLNGLPDLETGVKCAQSSSYDRASHNPELWQANGDAGQYIRIEPNGEAVMADLKGPGCIFRIWSANPQGTLRFYLDGATEPTYEFDFHRLFLGEFGSQTVPAPIVYKRDPANYFSASDCYLPIPYAKSCKITADQAHGQYYHFGYKTYPAGTTVPTFRVPFSPEENAKLRAVADVWSRLGTQPQNPGIGVQRMDQNLQLAPGEKKTVAVLPGPAMVVALRAKLTSDERYILRKVMLRAFWDGETEPSVCTPFGDFFGGAWEEPRYRSLPLGMTERGYYCYFRMPYRRQAVFELENQGRLPVGVEWEISFRPMAIPASFGTFHAKWRREAPCRQFDYPILEATGAGKFVGVMLFIEHPVPGWWGEGDEKIWVDGEDFPSTFGTGSEDYFGDAWGIRWLDQPVFGDNYENGPRSCCYRFHISDSVPFRKSYRMVIENYDPGVDDYATVAYWYARPGSTDFFRDVPVEDRVPWVRAIAGATQAEDMFVQSLPPGATIVDDALLDYEYSGGQAVSLGDRLPGDQLGPGTFTVQAEGAYLVQVLGEPGQSPANLTVTVDGAQLRAQAPLTDLGAAVFGPKQLAAGEHQITIGFAAPTSGVLDCLTLAPTRSEGTLEAENMEVVDARGPMPAPQGMTYGSGHLAGRQGAQLFFTPTEDGSYVTLAFEAPRAGTYHLNWYASKSHDYAIYQAELDGQLLGEPVDLYAPQWQVAAAEATNIVELTAGRHLIRFRATGKNPESKGYYLGLDALTLDPAE